MNHNRNSKIIFAVLLFILLFSASAIALELPAGLKAIEEYNKQQAAEILQKVSIFIAFLAGIVSLFSPCILPILPAYFSFTFKEKRNITKMTFIFFLGFSVIFVSLGLLAASIGIPLISLQENLSPLIFIGGLILIVFGILSLFGKGFSSFIKIHKKVGNDYAGVFVMGLAFSIGWVACLGPILAGILIMAGVFGNFLYASLLLFSYSLGIFIPLLVISVFYDRYNLSESRIIKGKVFSFTLSGKQLLFHSTNIFSGALLIMVGLIFIFFGNTAPLNAFDLFGVREYFYIVQRMLLNIPSEIHIATGLIFVFVIILLSKKHFHVLKKYLKK